MISGLALLQSPSQRRFQAPLILRTKLGPLNQLSFFLCAVGQLRQANFALLLRRKSGILDKLLQAVTTATKGRTVLLLQNILYFKENIPMDVNNAESFKTYIAFTLLTKALVIFTFS